MLPLSLLKTAQGHPMLIELKNGDTYNGRLAACNMFMNIYLKDVICTSRTGDRFWKIPECYIRGNSIKYMRIPDEVLAMVPEDSSQGKGKIGAGRGRGGRGGRDGRGVGGRGVGGRGGRGDHDGRGKSEIISFQVFPMNLPPFFLHLSI